jgi:hypothetical protein
LILGARERIYRTVFAPLASVNASMLYSVAFTAVMYVIAHFM